MFNYNGFGAKTRRSADTEPEVRRRTKGPFGIQRRYIWAADVMR